MNLQQVIVAFGLTLVTTNSWAAPPRTYQVSGPVVAINDEVVVIQKGKETLEIARTSETKVGKKFKAKVGDKVVVRYRMTAESLEAKTDTAMTAADPATEKKSEPPSK